MPHLNAEEDPMERTGDHELGKSSGSCSSVCCACCSWQVWFSADPDQGMEQAATSYREHALQAHERPPAQSR